MVSEQLVNDSISFSTTILQILSDALQLALQYTEPSTLKKGESENGAKEYLAAVAAVAALHQ